MSCKDLLIGALIAVSVAYGTFQYENLTIVPAMDLTGVRGQNLPVIVVIETPLAIANKAVENGLVSEADKMRVKGLAWYNDLLTTCLVWVPRLALDTVWVWVHEIHGHCDQGEFHK